MHTSVSTSGDTSLASCRSLTKVSVLEVAWLAPPAQGSQNRLNNLLLMVLRRNAVLKRFSGSEEMASY